MTTIKSLILMTAVLVGSGVAQAASWKPANRPSTVVRRVEADSYAKGLSVKTQDVDSSLLRIEGKVTGLSTLGGGSNDMYGGMEAAVNAHPGAKFGSNNSENYAVVKSTSVMAYPGEGHKVIAEKLVAAGFGKIVSSDAQGTVIDTSK